MKGGNNIMLNITCKNFIHISLDEKKMVLDWRNSDRVRLKMNNQETIPLENHLKFVDSLKNRKDCVYYLFYINDEPVGVFDLIDIDENKKSCIVGSYIGNIKYGMGGGVLFYYNIYTAFEKYNIDKVFANVLKTNKRIYTYHKQILEAIDEYENEKEWYISWNQNIWQRIKRNMPNLITDLRNVNTKWID